MTYATVSGLIRRVQTTQEEILCDVSVEHYIGVLEKRPSLSVSVRFDLQSPRWSAKDRRAPILKEGQYITASGTFTALVRDDQGKIVGIKILADTVVNAGLRVGLRQPNGPTGESAQSLLPIIFHSV